MSCYFHGMSDFKSEINPFSTPADADRDSVKHVAELAPAINIALAQGQRAFPLPIGIVDAVARGLEASGWSTSIRDRNPETTGVLVVTPKI